VARLTRYPSTEVDRLFATVVEGGYCIGCGACAAVAEAPIAMEFDRLGRLQPRLTAAPNDAPVVDVCPFSERSADEDVLAERFRDECDHDARIGYHLWTCAGWAKNGDRSQGSSGGLTTWFLAELVRRDMVDGVLHVQPTTDEERRLFRYAPAFTAEEVRAGAKTRYYPVEMSDVLSFARENPGRYAVVGVPCFIKAVRRLCQVDGELDERIAYTVALVCGHLKTTNFAASLAWQAGLEPHGLTGIDFRRKLHGRPANRYGAELVGTRMGEPDKPAQIVRPMTDFEGADWGQGYFKHQACDYCDDVLGETADVTFGDAWLPQYTDDHRGANVVVVRRPDLRRVLQEAAAAGEVHLEDLSAEDVARSQDAGLRHRRAGLAYRLARTDAAGSWRPPKRVRPRRMHLSKRQREIFALRVRLVVASHASFVAALAAKDYSVHRDAMVPLVRRYRALYARRSMRERVTGRARRVAGRVRRRFLARSRASREA
jgi:coenzyme F420-reducing hydrogenase beta subunit